MSESVEHSVACDVFRPGGGTCNCGGRGCVKGCDPVRYPVLKPLSYSLATLEPDAVDEKYAPPKVVGGEWEPSIPATVSKYVDREFHGATIGRYSCSVNVPTGQLPRVVRELAALMTDEQRAALAEAIGQRATDLEERAWGVIANAGGGDWTRESNEWRKAAALWREAYHAKLGIQPRDPTKAVADELARGRESGPGITTLPERREPLAFLDEDLLCEDA